MAASQQWQVAALGGYLTNNSISEEIRRQAMGECVLAQFSRPLKRGYGKRQGDTIYYNRTDRVATGGDEVAEDEDIPTTSLAISKGSLVVKKLVNSIDFTEELDIFSDWDPDGIFRSALADDAKETIDRKIYAQLRTAKVVYTPLGVAGSETETNAWAYTGTTAQAAAHSLNKFDLDAILEKALTLKMKPFDSQGNFLAIVGPGGARALRNDDDWEKAAHYGDPDRLFNAEIGKYNRFRFVEESEHLKNVLGTTAFKGEMFVLGRDAIMDATALPVQIRAESISGTLGTVWKIGWISYTGWGIVWNDHAATAAGATGRCRVIRVDST